MPTVIEPFTKTPSRQNPSTFSTDMDTRLSEENSRIEQMNAQSAENNVTAAKVASDASLTQTNKNTVATDKAIVQTAEATVLAAEARVQALVPITGTSYSTDALDTKFASRFASSGTINKQDDSNVFKTAVGNEYRMANTDRFTNLDGNVIDTYGEELVTNGDFSDGTTGWVSVSGGVLSSLNNTLIVESLAGDAAAAAGQLIAVEIGKSYTVSYFSSGDTNTVIGSSTNYGGTDLFNSTQTTFTATATKLYLSLYVNIASGKAIFDNISVKEITTVDMTNYIPEVIVQDQATNGLVVQSSVNAGDYVVVDKLVVSKLQVATTTANILLDDTSKFVVGYIVTVKNATGAIYSDTITAVNPNVSITFATSRVVTAEIYSVQLKEDIYRATEDIPALTSLTDARFEVRNYVSNQVLAYRKSDGLLGYETLFVDATDTDTANDVMTKNSWSKLSNGLYSKGLVKAAPLGMVQL